MTEEGGGGGWVRVKAEARTSARPLLLSSGCAPSIAPLRL